ncbi:MAG TPA: methyltransferase, partial [Gemmata sp.]
MPSPSTQPEPLPPMMALTQMVFGKAVSQAVSVVARFKLADHMATGPKTAAELATAAGLNAPHLYRVLRALAGWGVLAAEGDRFALTPVSELLRSDVPGSMRAVAVYVCDPWSWTPWGDLAGSVKTGTPAFDRVFGEGVFDYF